MCYFFLETGWPLFWQSKYFFFITDNGLPVNFTCIITFYFHQHVNIFKSTILHVFSSLNCFILNFLYYQDKKFINQLVDQSTIFYSQRCCRGAREGFIKTSPLSLNKDRAQNIYIFHLQYSYYHYLIINLSKCWIKPFNESRLQGWKICP